MIAKFANKQISENEFMSVKKSNQLVLQNMKQKYTGIVYLEKCKLSIEDEKEEKNK